MAGDPRFVAFHIDPEEKSIEVLYYICTTWF